MKIRRLDFSLLLIFDDLVRHQRTTVVAERLGLSQSAISHALTRLRALFDDPLFTRRPDGLTPTRRALDLAPKVRDILRMTEDAIGGNARFDPAQATRHFRIAANDLVATLFGPPIIAHLAAEAPATRLTSRFAVGETAFDALRKDQIDLAIGRFYAVPDDLDSTVLLHETFAVVARQEHPQIADSLDLEAYLRLDHLLVSFSGRLTGVVDEALARQGLRRRVLASMPMFLTAFAAVSTSDLIATVPARLANRLGPAFGLKVLEPPLAVDLFPISLVRHVSTRADPALAWFADCVGRIATTL